MVICVCTHAVCGHMCYSVPVEVRVGSLLPPGLHGSTCTCEAISYILREYLKQDKENITQREKNASKNNS